MAVLQNDGRIALAVAVAAQPIHLAWGRGSTDWDQLAVPEPSNATTLVDEVGRRLATHVGFCEPAATGEIELPSGAKYTSVAYPTPYVYVRVVYGFDDAIGQTLREMGVFLGSTPKAGVPAGQRYLLPADVQQPGRLYTLERFAAFTRNASVRESFEFVLPF